MFESEANELVASCSEIPRDIVSRFAECRGAVTGRTLIPWGEHCTECVWPTCYSTCDLYAPRPDGGCRRFVEGMVRIPSTGGLNPYVLKISFKRWAKLWSVANLKLYSVSQADRAESSDLRIAKYIQTVPVAKIRHTLSHKRYSLKKRRARRDRLCEAKPGCLMLECYNPNAAAVSMTLTIRHDEAPLAFQALVVMEPGFNRRRIAVAEIEKVVDLSSHFNIELTPNEIPDGLTLYFGTMEFVAETPAGTTTAGVRSDGGSNQRPCKCVVWDLDKTLWRGTLVEDDAHSIALRPGIREILEGLDERGILMSVASKNSYEDAMNMLRRLGVHEYFLVPQISWDPKSQGIKQIGKSLNIGLDSLLIVDDSQFEREEIKAACPEVMVLDAEDIGNILDLPCCRVSVTAESKSRRLLYRDQELRRGAQAGFQGEYLAFLRDCHLDLTVRTMTESTLDRVHELTQRTNQMNFSGNRYTRAQLWEILRSAAVDTYVLDCKDRFGSYGTVGFCVVERSEVRMTDLMFSCRIQGKRVEHAFVSYLIRKHRSMSRGDFSADYRKTTKNSGPGKVFDDLGFSVVREEEGGMRRLLFQRAKAPVDEGIVAIEDLTACSVSRLPSQGCR